MNDVTIALLRGINVGGHGRLPMVKLRQILSGLGAEDPRTYIQSGNAVYRGGPGAAAISVAIETEMGFRPHVLTLPFDDYAARLAENPFPELNVRAVTEPKILNVYFLDGTPAPLSDTILSLARNGERVAVVPGAAYLHAPEGIGTSKIAERLERALGVPATARNWKSAQAILALGRELTG